MSVIDILVREHEHILSLTSLFQAAANRIVDGRPPPKAFFETGLRLARSYADKHHHVKEEYMLFAQLAQKHDGQLDGHIERHRSQHEHLRNLLTLMSGALTSYEQQVDDAAKVLHRNGLDYAQTLRRHIASENEVFFPLAAQALTAEEAAVMLTEFERIEARSPGIEREMADGLAQMRALLD